MVIRYICKVFVIKCSARNKETGTNKLFTLLITYGKR